jgi:hypothetical protein
MVFYVLVEEPVAEKEVAETQMSIEPVDASEVAEMETEEVMPTSIEQPEAQGDQMVEDAEQAEVDEFNTAETNIEAVDEIGDDEEEEGEVDEARIMFYNALISITGRRG